VVGTEHARYYTIKVSQKTPPIFWLKPLPTDLFIQDTGLSEVPVSLFLDRLLNIDVILISGIRRLAKTSGGRLFGLPLFFLKHTPSPQLTLPIIRFWKYSLLRKLFIFLFARKPRRKQREIRSRFSSKFNLTQIYVPYTHSARIAPQKGEAE